MVVFPGPVDSLARERGIVDPSYTHDVPKLFAEWRKRLADSMPGSGAGPFLGRIRREVPSFVGYCAYEVDGQPV